MAEERTEQSRAWLWIGRLLRPTVFLALLLLLVFSVLLNVYLGIFVQSAFGGPRESTYREGETEKRVAILPLEGMINDEMAGGVRERLQLLRDNPPVALVLRINSNGGAVAASDRIWDRLKRFREDTGVPIVASFGATAASGGYYVAMPSDHIIAEPTSITGSIGVIAQAFTVEELLSKVGVTPETITASEATEKDEMNPFRSWTAEDRKRLRGLLNHAYERFVEVVKKGRAEKGLKDEALEAVTTGRVFTAAEAEKRKLIDARGYLHDAIAQAAELAGLERRPRVTMVQNARPVGWLRLLSGRSADALSGGPGRKPRRWLNELSSPRLLYRWQGAGTVAEAPAPSEG
jgi:protease-4